MIIFRHSIVVAAVATVFNPAVAVADQSVQVPIQEGNETQITRKSEQAAVKGSAEYFTGNVTITGQFQRTDPSRVGGAIVHFEPGARTAWHTHPLGQTLIVTEGVGWTQIAGGPVTEFNVGDILWCPPDQKHWHGATSHQGMTHTAIYESLNGSPVTWMEHVTDEEYQKVEID